MIVYTKQGKRFTVPDLFARGQGIQVFQFVGNETFTDPYDSSVWYWVGIKNDIDEVLGVTQNGETLFPTTSEADCIALNKSFYWDDANGYLFVHWIDAAGDWSVSRETSSYSEIIAGYASGYSKENNNVFDGVYYKPILSGLGGLSKEVDPTKLGLIAFDDSSITIVDQPGDFEEFPAAEAVGVPIWVYYADESATELTNDLRVFTGFSKGYTHDRANITFPVIEVRLFQNKPVCPNALTIDEFPNIGDREGKLKPWASGKIRRGILEPLNLDTLDSDFSGSVTFLAADPAHGKLSQISKLYDKEDNEITIVSSDLTNCTITATKPAGVAVSDLKDWTWEGQGYDIQNYFGYSRSYNNGLDIIQHGFAALTGTPYLNSTFEITRWEDQRLLNPQSCGVSIQSDKGFIEELVEPIVTSLQGVVEILGDGRVSFSSRDTSAKLTITIKVGNQPELPGIEIDSNETVSELVIEYAPNFRTKEALSYIYSETQEQTIRDYGINRRDPLSPVKTVLTEPADVAALGDEIMDTSADPVRLISATDQDIKEVRVFDIIAIDTGNFGNERLEYGEVLKIFPDYFSHTQSYEIRIVPDYVPIEEIPAQGFLFGDRLYNDPIYGVTTNE